MSISLAQADGYSWASHPWLNQKASYHRMVYEDRETLQNYQSCINIITWIITKFHMWEQSRCVIRCIAQLSDIEVKSLDQHIHSIWGTLGIYKNYQYGTPKFIYLTISLNRSDRNPDGNTIKILMEKNRDYIVQTLGKIGKFDSFNLQKLAEFHNKGLTLTKSMNPYELVSLWWESFGWSHEACEKLLCSTDGSFPLGVRNSTKELVAVVLYSHQPHTVRYNGKILWVIEHGETTEASTFPKYQWNGIMPILVTALHTEAINSGIRNVYWELRAEDIPGDKPNSINHGLKSGKVFHQNIHAPSLLINHVSIGWNTESYNVARKIPGYTSSSTGELRSFMIGSMEPSLFSPHMLEAYAKSIQR